MTEHNWVSIAVSGIQVLPDPQGKPVVFDLVPHTPSRMMYGCDRCHESLETAFGTLCNPQEDE